MISNKLNWQAISTAERIAVIETLKDVIGTSHGYIINFNNFSDLAITLTIEIEQQYISTLYNGLKQVVSISLSAPSESIKNPKEDWWVLLNVSFSKGEGKLKKEIPQVPG